MASRLLIQAAARALLSGAGEQDQVHADEQKADCGMRGWAAGLGAAGRIAEQQLVYAEIAPEILDQSKRRENDAEPSGDAGKQAHRAPRLGPGKHGEPHSGDQEHHGGARFRRRDTRPDALQQIEVESPAHEHGRCKRGHDDPGDPRRQVPAGTRLDLHYAYFTNSFHMKCSAATAAWVGAAGSSGRERLAAGSPSHSPREPFEPDAVIGTALFADKAQYEKRRVVGGRGHVHHV
jgi:hypothetical protein